jgi:sulfate permease, SulP family
MNDETPTPFPIPSRWLRWFPGLALFRGYRRSWLLPDVVAGVTVCLVMIPSVIAYAGLIGIPPQYGLYAALVPLLVYPLFGSSRQVIVGPDIAISLLMASAVVPLAGGDGVRAASLSAVVALLSGVFLFLGGRAKFGAVADFFSKPVLVGYMTGAALILMASQMGKLFGIPLKRTEFFPSLAELTQRLPETDGPTLAVGAGFLGLLLVLRRFAPKVPATLVGCVVAIAASWALGLEKHGVAVVGMFPRGLPRLAWPDVTLRDVNALFPACIGVALLTYTECILLAKAFAEKHRYEVNANQELTALGVADFITGLFHGFAVTGSQARTTLSDAAGGQTPLVSLVAAATLAVFLSFLTPLIALLPVAALAAMLIYAGFGLVEFDVMRRIYRYYPKSSMLAALTTAGVLVGGVIPGILLGVTVSLIGLIDRISRPMDTVLREVPGHGFHDVGENVAGQTLPGLIAYRFYAPLLFSNVGYFCERVRALIERSPEPVRWLVLDAQAVTDVDVTASEALMALKEELEAKGIALKIARANRPLREILQRAGVTHDLGEGSFFPSVHGAVAAFLRGGARL